MKQIARLKKLLAMTTSEHDGEALSALRAAQRYAANIGVNWHDWDITVRQRTPGPARYTAPTTGTYTHVFIFTAGGSR